MSCRQRASLAGDVRAIIVHRPGRYDRLQLEEVPDPVAERGQVVIRVDACGVNYADCLVRMGLYASARRYVGWPITPGFEVAGEVIAVGEGVREVALGARVFAVTRFGGYATQVVVPESQVFPIPKALNLTEAAAFPAVHLSAWFALCELIRMRSGMRVLVHSAAGGVGGALVQLARLQGGRVVGVVGGPHKVAAVHALGAEAVIDKSLEPLWAAAERFAPDGFDIVCDANGVATLRESYRHLAPAGRLVVYGFHSMLSTHGGRTPWLKLILGWLRTPRFSPLALTTENRSVLAFNLSYLFDRISLFREAMTWLCARLEDGSLRPPKVTTYPLERVADAHRALESGTTVGKLVLTP